MRYLIILLFYTNFAYSESYKIKERIVHDTYDELVWEMKKEVTIDGKKKKIKLINKDFSPLKEKYKYKEWKCNPWKVSGITHEGNYLLRRYQLNDCLPCIDAGAGHLCSYPYFEVIFVTELYDLYYYGNKDQLGGLDYLNARIGAGNYKALDLKDDGTKEIMIFINMGSREKFYMKKVRAKIIKTGEADTFYEHRVTKYNTRLRKIETGVTFTKLMRKQKYKLIFDRITDGAYELLSNPDELKIRDKDLRILFEINPAASIMKFQTRD